VRLRVFARNQSLKFTIGARRNAAFSGADSVTFSFGSRSKSAYFAANQLPPSFPKRVCFVPSNESWWKYCSDDPLLSLSPLFIPLVNIYIFPTRSFRSNAVYDRYETSSLFDSLLLLRKRITVPSNYFAFRIATTAVAMTTRLRLRLRLGRFCKSH